MTIADNPPRPFWPMLRGFAGWRPSTLGADLLAGLTLAAIAVPEQMATATLAGLAPRVGFLALLAGAIGFTLFGANRILSVGADSTIAPIFAGALALIAAKGSADYAADAAALALGVGIILTIAGAFRLGFIADLLSIPVTTGFLAGIAVHILASQAPALLGVPPPPGSPMQKLLALAEQAGASNPWTLALGLGVLAIVLIGERIGPRIPSALIALAFATIATITLSLEARGVDTLGDIAGAAPAFSFPWLSLRTVVDIAPLAAIISVVVMVQTAATTRGFVSDPAAGPDVDADFIGLGAANLLAGLTGAFPVNASPPRTAVAVETGAASPICALVCAGLALALSLYGGAWLAHVPRAALAGVLLFVAARIVRIGVMREVFQRGAGEFVLIVTTLLAIVALPIEQGVGLGIILSLLHGVWTTTRARAVEFERIPGSSIWWPIGKTPRGELLTGVRVIGLQAPLSFLNAYEFQQQLRDFTKSGTKLLIIEANAVVEIDYTGAKILSDLIKRLHGEGLDVAVARLESIRARESFARLGLERLIGEDHLFHSVEEAIVALWPVRSKPPA